MRILISFMKHNMICLVYVDDTIIWSLHERNINRTISKLKDLNFDLTDEGDVDNFLGIEIENLEGNSFKMSQPALIKTIIERQKIYCYWKLFSIHEAFN